MNTDVEEAIKSCTTCLAFWTPGQRTKQCQTKPGRPRESVGADITSNYKCYLYMVDYHSKFLVVKQVEGFSADNLLKTC